MRFVALGASDSVGASSYFLQIDGYNILLDCGKGRIPNTQITYDPDFTGLIPGVLTTITDLDAILISHGHYDHIGHLPEITDRCLDTPVYATRLTQKLGSYLMMDGSYMPDSTEEQRLARTVRVSRALDRIHPVGYMQTFSLGPVRVTFYEAGHVPGAAMIHIESEREGSILYTGDFSPHPSMLTSGCVLPVNLKPDRLLLCGLHAKHPRYKAADNKEEALGEIRSALEEGEPCLLAMRELTKSGEMVSFLSREMAEGRLPAAKIFIDDRCRMLAERLREVGIAALNEHCRRFPRLHAGTKPEPGIYIGGKRSARFFEHVIECTFTLHADYRDCVDLICTLSPKTVVVVHSPKDDSWGHHGNTALENTIAGPSFLYPETGREYIL